MHEVFLSSQADRSRHAIAAAAARDRVLATRWKHSVSFRPIVAQKPDLHLIFTSFGRNSATVLRHTFSDEFRVGNDGKRYREVTL
ncbi:hypothetical protein ACEWPM_015860 [Roseovarius sp. S4756]|uniref:hypothetical protein n=1 Tax=Roseovarius maritimus TaxID=3342637 RepID=UPI003727FE37